MDRKRKKDIQRLSKSSGRQIERVKRKKNKWVIERGTKK